MKFYFTCIYLLSLFIGNNCFGQSLAAKADSLFDVAEFELASIGYHEAIFLENNADKRATYLLKRIDALKQLKQFNIAATEAEQFVFPVNAELGFALKYEAALNYFLTGEYILSLLQIQWIEKLYPQFYSDKKVLKIKALCYLRDLNTSELSEFIQSNEVKNIYGTKDLQGWLIRFENRKVKNTKTAEWFSSFVPGWGQVYAGYFWQGTASFLLNATALGFMGYNFWLTNYITTFTVGSGLLQQFYFGGRRRTAYLVDKRNFETNLKYELELLELME